jgi:hypothetical protein
MLLNFPASQLPFFSAFSYSACLLLNFPASKLPFFSAFLLLSLPASALIFFILLLSQHHSILPQLNI